MSLATLITSPALIDAARHPPKRIEEYIGRASTGTSALSVARMVSLTGWSEPSQIPEFEEMRSRPNCRTKSTSLRPAKH